MATIPQQLLDEIEALKKAGKYDKALKKVNAMLVRDPSNKEALYQVADIEYRRGEILKAEKPVDFLLTSNKEDPMWRYIKGVLAMEKTDRQQAKKLFKQAMTLMEGDNPEILRCYGLCEYRSGNREEGITFLLKSFKINKLDAEVILNLVEVSILEHNHNSAKKYIEHYRSSHDELQCFDRHISYYDEKIELFEEYLKG